MKVRELIEKLFEHDLDLEVLCEIVNPESDVTYTELVSSVKEGEENMKYDCLSRRRTIPETVVILGLSDL